MINGNAVCGSVGGAVDCFPPIVFTLLQPRNAFGFDNLDLNGSEEAVVNVDMISRRVLAEFEEMPGMALTKEPSSALTIAIVAVTPRAATPAPMDARAAPCIVPKRRR